jgi:TetR/AcrR family transcriptional repressor of nem operon
MSKSPSASYNNLVTKSRDLFWLRGYQNITRDELANYLGVSTSLIYTKYGKAMMFVDALDTYIDTYTNPILQEIKKSEKGIETFREFFNNIIDAFADKTFPRGCMLVNSIVEMHHHHDKLKLVEMYARYFDNMQETYVVILERAYTLGEIRFYAKLEQYAKLLSGLILGMMVMYKYQSKEEIRQYIDNQLSLIKEGGGRVPLLTSAAKSRAATFLFSSRNATAGSGYWGGRATA